MGIKTGIKRILNELIPGKEMSELKELRAKAEKLQTEVETLQRESYQARHEASEYAERMKRTIPGLFKKSNDELRKLARLHVDESEDGSWKVVTQYCCCGGCDVEWYSFDDERDALLYAVLLHEIGYKPSNNVACPECYAEYMQECV